ncbi:MAG: hypothetical protein B7Z55_10080, partial [Planctomycetales bacterium 12-60-4]
DSRELLEAKEKFRAAMKSWDMVKQQSEAQFSRLFQSSYQAAKAACEATEEQKPRPTTSEL